MSKIILVTGGSGFIGSNFIKYFIAKHKDYKIVNFDALTYAGNLNNLTSVIEHPNYVFVKGDITNVKDVQNVFEQYKPNYIIHFAAESHVDRSILDANVFVHTNVLGTQILLNYSLEHKIEKFVHISTDEVYGSLGSEGLFTELSPLKPSSPYSASKASSDLLVLAASKTYGMNVNITRCSNNYGQYQFPEKLLPLMIHNAIHDIELPVYGSGLNIRDWIHVQDHCKAIDLVFREGKEGQVYNIGANNEWKNIDLIKLLLDILKKPESLIRFVKDRPGHDLRYAIDSEKIQKELGWKPEIEFKEGLIKTIEWYKNHPNWIKEIVSGDYRQYYEIMYKNR